MADITLQGNSCHTNGELPAVGAALPALSLVDGELNNRTLDDYAGKRKLISIVPSLDTGVCAKSTNVFNEAMAARAGAVALVDRGARHLGIRIDLGDLVDRVAEQRRQLDATIAAQPDSRAYLERLEGMAAAQGEIPSADDIAAQVERFLQDTAEGDEPFRPEV